jgi:hypothetical protein
VRYRRRQRAAEKRFGATEVADAGWCRQRHPNGHVGLKIRNLGTGQQSIGEAGKVVHATDHVTPTAFVDKHNWWITVMKQLLAELI